MQVTVQYAEEHLDDLIDAALRGEEILISKSSGSVFKLEPIEAIPTDHPSL